MLRLSETDKRGKTMNLTSNDRSQNVCRNYYWLEPLYYDNWEKYLCVENSSPLPIHLNYHFGIHCHLPEKTKNHSLKIDLNLISSFHINNYYKLYSFMIAIHFVQFLELKKKNCFMHVNNSILYNALLRK